MGQESDSEKGRLLEHIEDAEGRVLKYLGYGSLDPEKSPTPYSIVFDTNELLKKVETEHVVEYLEYTYRAWANTMQRDRAIAFRPVPFNERIERHLLGLFCEQVRGLGAPVTLEMEEKVFQNLMAEKIS